MKSLEVEIGKALEDISLEVAKELEVAAEETAKETAKLLEETSPKKTGKYSRDWKVTNKKVGVKKTYVIYNRQGQLTHLLEFGHATRNGGRTRAFPHIDPASKFASETFEKKVRDKLGK